MENFNEKRKHYFNKLKRYTEYVKKLASQKKNEKIVEILLNPQNEKELEFCNHYIMYIDDTIKLTINASCNNIIDINPEESIYIDFLTDLINTIQNFDSIEEAKKIYSKYEKNYEQIAQICYQMIVITITNSDKLVEELFEKCNIDFTDELEVMKLEILIKKFSEQVEPEILPTSEEAINDFILFVKHYHKLYINGIKDNNNLEIIE